MSENTIVECKTDSGKLRVAAYVRVATSDEEESNKYQAQLRHYTEYIESRHDWEFAGLYADVFVREPRRAFDEPEGGAANE